MGLLLSIFVIYVAVVEFLDVYSNFRIRLQPAAASTSDLSPLIRRYEEGLHKERRRILKILEEYRKLELDDRPGSSRENFPPSDSRSAPLSDHVRPGSSKENFPPSDSRSPSPPLSNHVRPGSSRENFPPSIVYTPDSRSPSPPLSNHVSCYSVSENTTDDERWPNSFPTAPRNSFCDDSPEEGHTDLQSITFDSTDFWSSKARIQKKKSKKRVKFGLNAEELEPDWSRAPSPICKIITPLQKSKPVNFGSMQITDLNEQIVPEDYWRRSPSPFRDFLETSPSPQDVSWYANKKPVSSDEDEEKPFFGFEFLEALDGLKLRRRSTDFSKSDRHLASSNAWDPNKQMLSSDEETEDSPSFDEKFMDALDGLTPPKRSFRFKKGRRKQNAETKQNGIDLEATVQKFTVVDHLEEGASGKERNAAENAFWLIFSGEYTKAMNKDWHGQHFCCWQCDESLTGQRYVLRDEHPYCVTCYESVFANSCEKCSRTIGIDSKDLSYKDKHWHEACFLCATCGDSLVDKQFGSKGDRIYCGRCYDEQFASRCDGCGQIFRAGTKKMEYKTRQWHEKCFCCCVCKTPIGTQSFIPREQEIYCAKCYEEKYATRCIKCNKVITSGGVTYKNEPWHRECFTCTHCNTSLAGARFTSRDDKPYCAECFGELFAKRCTACNKPITGIGGTKFISFEDRHWHNDCFFCASCRTSLVGRGFITDADDIICPECAKQKLM